MEHFSTERLDIGDEIAVFIYFYGKRLRRIGKVIKKTKAGLVDIKIENGRTIRFKKDGREYGATGRLHNSTWLEYATPEEIAEIKKETMRNNMITRLKNTKWENLNDEKLAQIIKIIDIKAGRTAESEG